MKFFFNRENLEKTEDKQIFKIKRNVAYYISFSAYIQCLMDIAFDIAYLLHPLYPFFYLLSQKYIANKKNISDIFHRKISFINSILNGNDKIINSIIHSRHSSLIT